MATSFEQFQFLDEEGRQEIYKWSQRRQKKYRGFGKFVYLMKIFAFDKSLMKSFVNNVNVIVIVQMFLAGIFTYLCSFANLYFEVHVTLFVSPLVFPLAFSINTDFQRREKVLEDLANFKASTMVWFFCVRDWRIPGEFDESFMRAVSSKTKGLMFHLREYLLTEKSNQRNFILRVIYEDLSDVAQINEKIRTSKLESTAPLIARIIHLHYLMCLAFERLRVIREYRSPRSIRSFTKIFIFALPLLLAPYYVYLGRQVNNSWSPYFIAVLVAFLFGALQGVQDKLDDPFDGMSEDDINLETLDEWTSQSLEATANRIIKVGRFTVSVSKQGKVEVSAANPPPGAVKREESFGVNKAHTRKKLGLLPWQRQLSQLYSDEEMSPDREEIKEMHPYKDMLSNLPGNATIVRGGHVKEKRNLEDILQSTSSQNTINPVFDQGFFQTPNSTMQRTVDSQQSLGKKVQFDRIFYGSGDPQSPKEQLSTEKQEGYHPAFEAPKSFRYLFLQDDEHPVMQPEPLKRQSSLPTAAYVSFPNMLESSVPRKRSPPKERSESTGLLPHPGIGVASYINSMNKEKLRKISAPLLQPAYHDDARSPETISISSDDSIGIVMTSKTSQETPSNGLNSIFHVKKAKPVSLSTINTGLKEDSSPDMAKVETDVEKSLRKTKYDEDAKKDFPKPVDCPCIIEMKQSTSKTKLLAEDLENDHVYGATNVDVIERMSRSTGTPAEQRKAPKKKFAVTKSNVNSKLSAPKIDPPESSSNDSLSKVVGKLKDEEVFL